MNHNLLRTSLFFTLVMVYFATAVMAAEQDSGGIIRFKWAFGALSQHETGSWKLASVTSDTVLRSGDKIKLFIAPETKCYIYIIYLGSNNELMMLFPHDLSKPGISPPNKYKIPEGKRWFELNSDTGPEKFFLLASAKRLVELEKAYQQSSTAPNSVVTNKETVETILNIIDKAKHRHTRLSTPAERPVRLGGNFRGNLNSKKSANTYDITQLSVEITAKDFFSRTFTIDHQ